MEIIPAIDIIDGKCVRLEQGNYSSCKIYSDTPFEVAKMYDEAGVRRLHLVDLDGAKATGVVNIDILENICKHTSLSVDFGGGVKSEEDIQRVFGAGADYICVGSIAQSDPARLMKWLEKYGEERIIVSVDVWNTKVCINGWKKITDMTIFRLIDNYRGKIRHLMCTDITCDGMLAGPSVGLYQDLLSRYPEIQLIASGGVRSMEDLRELALAGVQATVVGKAIYEKRIELQDIIETLC